MKEMRKLQLPQEIKNRLISRLIDLIEKKI